MVMRRYIPVIAVAVVTVLLLGSLLFGLLLDPGRRLETWETALDAYLGFAESSFEDDWRVLDSERATSSYRFHRGMSLATYGSGSYYATSVTYGQAIAPSVSLTPNLPGLRLPSSGRPLPYPPQDVWCVLLAGDQSGRTGDLLIFVALHQDLYGAAWVVHEAGDAPFGSDLEADLREIGCAGVADAALR
jgi:hypothetical protein